ncbi:hypothetical protein NMG60_11018491 [Bertholletia excelsa]
MDPGVPIFPHQNFIGFKAAADELVDENSNDLPPFLPNRSLNAVPSCTGSFTEDDDYLEACDFSGVVLECIERMLMEEDMEEKNCMFQESSALQAAERSFYEVLGEKFHPSHNPSIHIFAQNYESPVGKTRDSVTGKSCSTTDSTIDGSLADHGGNFGLSKLESSCTQGVSMKNRSCFSWSRSSGVEAEGLVDLPSERRVNEASRFLRRGNSLCFDSGSNLVKYSVGFVARKETKYGNDHFFDRPRGRKSPRCGDLGKEEGRSSKYSAVCAEKTIRSEMFDMVLLSDKGTSESESVLRKAFQNGVNRHGSNQGEGKGEVIDLTTCLTLCAQAVASDNLASANELLKQIRKHSSPMGDGMQRLAHYFADGIEARISGSGTQSYLQVSLRPTSAADVLRAYHLFLAICPFKNLSNFYANKTIFNVAKKATKLHIIDFGILYGFQWPSLIQSLSSRPGGPPKLRITGIDFPNPGFMPSERVEETGHCLANYSDSFKVPFEFNAIAKQWEAIKLEDLKLEKDEVLAVNCHFRFRHLLDETVMEESPRNKVLNLINKMNPHVYVLGVVHGSYNSPFFTKRFREALFHYSSKFEMLESIVPREIHERVLIERQILGWDLLNVIACEGAERIERPETYKQWQARHLRAGFRQLPLDREIMNMGRKMLKNRYHKEFMMGEDGSWVLQGWKGRIVCALSCWKPVH